MTAVAPSMLSGIFLPLRPRHFGLDRLGDVGEAAVDDAARGELADQFEQARGARIDRVEAVAEARHIALLLGEEAVEPGRDRLLERLPRIDRRGDVAEEVAAPARRRRHARRPAR